MHHEMRRRDRCLSDEDARAVLAKGQFGTLATITAEGEPYAVPLSYVLWNGEVYFHCAITGEKVDNIAANANVCFSVVTRQEPTTATGYSVYYESCTVFGKARRIVDETEFCESLLALSAKYFPDNLDMFESELHSQRDRTAVYAVSIDRITGKSKPKPR